MPFSALKRESLDDPALSVGFIMAMLARMSRKSPLDDPQQAVFAWARFRRLMRFLFLLTVGIVALAMAVLYKQGSAASVHYYIAIALGIGFTMLLTGALMGLMFLSSGTGHDESVEDFTNDHWRSEDRDQADP